MADDELALVRDMYFCGFYNESQLISQKQKFTSSLSNEERIILQSCASTAQLLAKNRSTGLDEAIGKYLNSDSSALRAFGFFLQIYKEILTSSLLSSSSTLSSLSDGCRQSIQKHTQAIEELHQRNPSPMIKILLSQSYALSHQFQNAINYTYPSSQDTETLPELQALRAQFMLEMNRPDLAREISNTLNRLNDDTGLCRMITGVCDLYDANGEEALSNFTSASALIQEQSQMWGGNPVKEEDSLSLVNQKAIAMLSLQAVQEAYEELRESFKKNSDDPNTLVNLICCSRKMRKHSDANMYFEHLKSLHPNHETVIQRQKIEAAFSNFPNQRLA